jgi:hypothetical protein
MSWKAVITIAVLLALTAAGCGGSAGHQRQRFAVIVMENAEFDDIAGNPGAPYINALARSYALADNYYAIRHPSLPNYLALTGGSTFGIESDCTDCSVDASSLVDQLEKAGISWKAYIESLPEPCSRAKELGRYAKRHNPFMYYRSIADDQDRCSRIVSGSTLDTDISSGSLPDFTWISPNLCHDAHDCPLRTGDRYLSRLVPALLKVLGPEGVLFLTWDEGTSEEGCCERAEGGHVVTIVAGDGAKTGARSSAAYDHFSLLRTIEDAWNLPRLRGAACTCTRAMTDLLSGSQG